jgi:acetyl/propionyl-CoA carboxylase alpha subunit
MREAKSAFGDESVYLEKFIEEPRHVEFQALADNYGNIVHLFERECSIQRRHQKIVEETPSQALDPKLRARMGETAKKVIKVSGYNNAGTVEFLLDKDKNFYFLEVNARLQVEHPVTEMTTGTDLVHQQILIASGEKLPFKQEEVYQRGHLEKFFSSKSRQDLAFVMTVDALDDYVILGIKTTIHFLKEVISHPQFKAGKTTTSFIKMYFDEREGKKKTDENLRLALIASAFNSLDKTPVRKAGEAAEKDVFSPWLTLGKWRLGGRK